MQSLEDLDRKPSDQIQREPREVGLFDEFVEVFVENLKLEAGVAPKYEWTFEPNNVAPELRVMK